MRISMNTDENIKMYLLEGNYEYDEGACQFIGCINKLPAGDFAGYLMEDANDPSKVTSIIRGQFVSLEKELGDGHLIRFMNFLPLEERLDNMKGQTFVNHYHKLICSHGLEGPYRGNRYKSKCDITDETGRPTAARVKIKLRSEVRFPIWFVLQEYTQPQKL